MRRECKFLEFGFDFSENTYTNSYFTSAVIVLLMFKICLEIRKAKLSSLMQLIHIVCILYTVQEGIPEKFVHFQSHSFLFNCYYTMALSSSFSRSVKRDSYQLSVLP